MSRKLIQVAVLKPVVSEAPTSFTTKDISEDERVRRAYRDLVHHRNYHAFIGGALSDHHSELGIRKDRSTSRRGMRWCKLER